MVSKSKSQTQKLASKLVKQILKTSPEPKRGATIIALQGNLGSGKTTFIQGFCKALGVKHGVTSPTFIIFRKHPISRFHFLDSRFSHVYHFDLYRLRKSKEILALGFKKIINNPENIVLIEWPEVIKKFLPKNTVWIKFGHGKKQSERKIDFFQKKL
ncbi:MAG: tRNA (adenosine(37)-N6)-threonylcarbamoyltransferase complex ATPase subunit type 1 TsaE [bacterium]|nr:tRNA (adenosine(37)-N6)-threonylcarbamoyltransferase complex ATPase subunit type 1 TsaE [bacterium]